MKEFSISTKIYFGTGSLDKLKELTHSKVLVVCDKFIETSGIVKKITDKLEGAEVSIFSDIVPDPTIEVIAKGVQKLKKCDAEVIVALGGGSSIDGAKAIKQYYKKLIESEDKNIKFYAIPTTSGTGSEVTEYAVVTNEKENLKYALTGKALIPEVAILDAELVKSVPKGITADTGMDVITHAIEAYVSKGANDFTDAFAEKSFSLAFNNLLSVYENGENLEARERIHNASCLAGLAFNQAGLGIVHSLAHAIGGKLHIPHGKANAIILPYIIKFNANIDNNNYIKDYSATAKKYYRLAKLVEINSSNIIIGINNLVKNLFDLQRKLSIPSTLIELGIDIDLINDSKEDIIEAALNDVCTKTNPREVVKKDLERLLNEIIGL